MMTASNREYSLVYPTEEHNLLTEMARLASSELITVVVGT